MLPTNRIDEVLVKSIAQLADARRDFVEQNWFFTSIYEEKDMKANKEDKR